MSTTLDNRVKLYNAVRNIAHHKIVNPSSETIRNTDKKLGFVKAVHLDPSDELCGTVDVQEYNISNFDSNSDTEGFVSGLHKGVYLSAIQDNKNGIFVIPFLNSDVVIETDPVSLREYVVQYSHADKVKLDAHSEIVVGVTETDPYDDSDDSPDYDELNPTGNQSHTIYTPTSALTEVMGGEGEDKKSTVEVTPDNVRIKHDKAELVADAQQLLAKYNAKEITINENGIYIGGSDASEPAVLGNQLASLLVEWLTALSQMLTPTSMGPQPPSNLAKFIELQSKVKAYQASSSGILSKIVKVK